jgi:hypothetical protein
MPPLLSEVLSILTSWQAIYTLSGLISLYWLSLGLKIRLLSYSKPRTAPLPPVSILSATHTLTGLRDFLQHLSRLSYPAEWEVVLVLNRLSDAEVAEAQKLIDLFSLPLKAVFIPEIPSGWSPKKYALWQGLSVSKYDWIVVLDADVRFSPTYLEKLMYHSGPSAEAVVGLGWLSGQGSSAAGFSAWEAALIQVESVGRAAWGFPYMTTGRGWAVKKAWLRLGLYLWRGLLSGDDDLTLQLIPRHKVKASAAATLSDAPQSWAHLLRRKRRHLLTAPQYSWDLLLSLGLPIFVYGLLWGLCIKDMTLWGAVGLVWTARVIAIYLSRPPLPLRTVLWEPVLVSWQWLYPLLAVWKSPNW